MIPNTLERLPFRTSGRKYASRSTTQRCLECCATIEPETVCRIVLRSKSASSHWRPRSSSAWPCGFLQSVVQTRKMGIWLAGKLGREHCEVKSKRLAKRDRPPLSTSPAPTGSPTPRPPRFGRLLGGVGARVYLPDRRRRAARQALRQGQEADGQLAGQAEEAAGAVTGD